MTSRFTELVVDCHRPHELAAFWCAVLGYEVIDTRDDLVEIAGWQPTVEAVRAGVTPPTLVFVRVPESKVVKNRLHIDVSLLDRGQDDVRSAFGQGDIDHVIVGGGIDLETRLEMVREVFQSSDRATVHMKDHMSGPEGFLPFVRSVLLGLDEYEPHESPRAILRARHPDLDADG